VDPREDHVASWSSSDYTRTVVEWAKREVSLVLLVVEDLDESRRLSTAALAPSATPNSTCRQTVCTTGPGLAAALAWIAAFDRRDRAGA
jgi:hypothetical protein